MNQSGFSLVEVIFAVALAAIFIPGIAALLSFSIFTVSQGKLQTQAYTLAQEGMEAVFSLKTRQTAAWNWTTTPLYTDPLLNEVYQPNFTGTDWQLGTITTTPVITTGPFTRTVTITPVHTCGHFICQFAWAPVNPNKRLITVTVTWLEKGEPQQVSLDAYVTQH